MNDNLKKQLENDLNKTLYNKIDEINILDEITTDTNELANILDDYLTNVDNLELKNNTETIDDIEFIENKEIDIDVDEEELLKNYDNNLQKIGHETLNDILNEDEKIYEDIEKSKNFQNEELGTKTANIEEILEQFEKQEEITTNNSEHTQNLVTSEFIDIENVDDIFEDKNNEEDIKEIIKNQKEFEEKEKFNITDILLFSLIFILSLLLVWMIFR